MARRLKYLSPLLLLIAFRAVTRTRALSRMLAAAETGTLTHLAQDEDRDLLRHVGA
ncbi:MAG TPA: hypothetical protein VK208_07510 [Pyrinomonadaceae bacterium]|nr:hypothetical protein [Pyrinomonadaceae bacterium]